MIAEEKSAKGILCAGQRTDWGVQVPLALDVGAGDDRAFSGSIIDLRRDGVDGEGDVCGVTNPAPGDPCVAMPDKNRYCGMYPICATMSSDNGGDLMDKTATVRARIQPRLKEHAETIFHRLGMNASQAITLFYKQVELRDGLPFDVAIPSAITKRTFEATDEGRDLVVCEDADDMFEKLGI